MGYESGKGLGKKSDGRLVPVQIKKNIGRNGIGIGAVVTTAGSSEGIILPSSEYWTKVAEATTVTEDRLSVSVSPPKIERRLFCDKDDDVVVFSSTLQTRLTKST